MSVFLENIHISLKTRTTMVSRPTKTLMRKIKIVMNTNTKKTWMNTNKKNTWMNTNKNEDSGEDVENGDSYEDEENVYEER